MAGLPKIAAYPLPDAGALPRARVDWRLAPSRAALLVHDMQGYFVRPFADGGTIDTVIAHIDILRRTCHAAGIPVFYTAQPGDQDPALRGLQQDFWGRGMSATADDQQVVAPLTPLPQDRVLTKWRYSAFERTTLDDDLRAAGRDQLIVTGIYASIGCMLTAAQAFMRDVQPFVVADAVADFNRERHDSALSYLADRCAVILTTDQTVATLIPAGAGAPLQQPS